MAFLKKAEVSLPGSLPKPDKFGNFWLGSKPQGPAIFLSGLLMRPGRYFASLGGDRGLLTAGPEIRYFASAEEALSALHSSQEKG